jgi:hypothetical protein
MARRGRQRADPAALDVEQSLITSLGRTRRYAVA